MSSGFVVKQPGVLSLLQDNGRTGQSHLGLTTGGPLDNYSARWANALLQNDAAATLIECSIGGLQLQATIYTSIVVTGAQLPLTINDKPVALWTVLSIKPGDIIELGLTTAGQRAYLAVAGGFTISPQFGSTATVLRESIGGLNGTKLQAGDSLPACEQRALPLISLPQAYRPVFSAQLTLRLIEGYQAEYFTAIERQRFYLNRYKVTPQADRMGYKLSGPAIQCQQRKLLSEGICQGAVQIPPDGQPIVLLNDRQTLGGYPKIGSVLSLDCNLLAQAGAGTTVLFTPISPQQAHNEIALAHARFNRICHTLFSHA